MPQVIGSRLHQQVAPEAPREVEDVGADVGIISSFGPSHSMCPGPPGPEMGELPRRFAGGVAILGHAVPVTPTTRSA